jgi:hypothetical protein
MAEEVPFIPKLEDIISHPSFTSSNIDEQQTVLDRTFSLYQQHAKPEDHENLFQLKTQFDQQIGVDRLNLEVGSMIPDETLRTDENMGFLKKHLVSYWNDSNGLTQEPRSIAPIRLNRLTEEEVSSLVTDAMSGKQLPILLPSEFNRVKTMIDETGTDNPMVRAMADSVLSQNEKYREISERFGTDSEFANSAPNRWGKDQKLEDVAGKAFDALRNLNGLQRKQDSVSRWETRGDELGDLYSFKRKASLGNVWEIKMKGQSGPSIEVAFDRELDRSKDEDVVEFETKMIEAARKGFSQLSDDSQGLFINTDQERAEKLWGGENRGFWGEARAQLDRNVTPLIPATMAGASGALSFLEDKTIGRDGLKLYGDFSWFGTNQQMWSGMADTLRGSASHTGGQRQIMSNGWGWGWDPSIISDKAVGFGATIAEVLATKKAPVAGVALLSAQASQQSYSSLYKKAVENEFSEDDAHRIAQNGSAIEGLVTGTLQYASGRLLTDNAFASTGIRNYITKMLGNPANRGRIGKAMQETATSFAAALPGDVATNLTAGQLTRLASAVIEDISMGGHERVSDFIDLSSWEAFKQSEFGRGTFDDILFGMVGAGTFGVTNPRGIQTPEAPTMTGAAFGRDPRYPTLVSGKEGVVLYRDVLDRNAQRVDPSSMQGWTQLRFPTLEEADAFAQMARDVDDLTNLYIEQDVQRGSRFRDTVTPEQRSAYTSLVQQLQRTAASRKAFQEGQTTEVGLSAHSSLSEAIEAARNYANNFFTDSGKTIPEQRAELVERLMDEGTNRAKDWEQERQNFINNLKSPKQPADAKAQARISELEVEMGSLDPDSPEFSVRQQEYARLSTTPRKQRTIADEQAAQAADRWIASQKAQVRESLRAKAEGQADRVFNVENSLSLEGNVATFDVRTPELAEAINKRFAIEERTVEAEDGTSRTVYEVRFAQPTGPDGAPAPKSAQESASVIASRTGGENPAPTTGSRSAAESADTIVKAARENAEGVVREMEDQLTGKVSVQENQPAPKSAEESANAIQEAETAARAAESNLGPEGAAPVAQPKGQPAASGQRGPTPQRQRELLSGSMERAGAAVDIIERLDAGDTPSKSEVAQGIAALDTELRRVDTNLSGPERDWLVGTLRKMRKDLTAAQQKKAKSTRPAVAAVEAAVTAEVAPPKRQGSKPNPNKRERVSVPEEGNPSGTRTADRLTNPDAPPVRQVIEESLTGETGRSPEEVTAAIDAVPEAEVVAVAKEKVARKRTARRPSTDAVVAKSVPDDTPNQKGPKNEADFSESTKAAIDIQKGSKLPVGLTEANRKRPFTEADRAAIAEDLGVATTDPAQLGRILKERHGKAGETGSRVKTITRSEEGVAKDGREDDIDAIARGDDAEVVSDYGDGIQKVRVGDETFWRDENAVKPEPPKQGMKNPRSGNRRSQSGSTIIFGELADLAVRGIKAGWNFAKFVAESIGRWGERFMPAFREVWESVASSFAERVDTRPLTDAERQSALVQYDNPRPQEQFMLPVDHPLAKDLADLRGTTARQKAFNKSVEDFSRQAVRNGQMTEEAMATLLKDTNSIYDGNLLTNPGNQYLRLTQPLWKVMRDIHPQLGRAMLAFEHFHLQLAKDYGERVQEFRKALGKLSKAEQVQFNMLIRNGDSGALNTFLQTRPQLAQGWSDWAIHREDILAVADANGYKIGRIDDYFPTKVTNYGKLHDLIAQTDLKGPIDDAISKAERAANRPLTDQEKTDIANRIVGKSFSSRGKSSHSKARKLEELTEEMAKLYDSPGAALDNYLHTVTRDIALSRFFGAEAIAYARGGSVDQHLPLPRSSSIGSLLHDLTQSGGINASKQREAIKLIHDRLGYKPSPPIVQSLRVANVPLALNTPVRALNQSQELVYSLYDHGLFDTLAGIFQPQRGKLTIFDLGANQSLNLTNGEAFFPAMNELVWKWSGYKLMDAFAGNTYINSYMNKMRRMSDVELEAHLEPWRRFLQEDPSIVAQRIKQGDTSSHDAKFIAFAQLSEIRPTSLSSMPLSYINNPGARLGYNLKVYAVHQLDLLRDRFMTAYRKGDTVGALRGILALSGSLVMAGAGINEVQDLILGRRKNFTSHVHENMLKLMLWSNYQSKQVGRGDIMGVLSNLFNTPLIDFAENLIRTYNKADANAAAGLSWAEDLKNSPLIEQIPVPFGISHLAYNWYSQKSEERQLDYFKADYSDTTTNLADTYNRLERAGKDKRERGGSQQEFLRLAKFNYIKQSTETLMKDAIAEKDLSTAADLAVNLGRVAEQPQIWDQERARFQTLIKNRKKK